MSVKSDRKVFSRSDTVGKNLIFYFKKLRYKGNNCFKYMLYHKAEVKARPGFTGLSAKNSFLRLLL